MKRLPLFSSVLALSLAIGTPAAMAHVGHGDEFQATGGVNRVEVNTETDPLLGIQVSPIEPAADGSGAVLIPVTALVDDNGRQLVFVQYENFYEPVDVTLGETQGDLIAVTEGLSIGEQLVTQGSLNLYAESRKTQTAEESPTETAPAEAAAPMTDDAHAHADAEGVPHSHDAEGNMVETDASEAAATETAEASGGIPKSLLAVIGGGVGLAVGAAILTSGNRKKNSDF
jgi:membrane fusion protein, cation efflux system